jgi:hypothetical protein
MAITTFGTVHYESILQSEDSNRDKLRAFDSTYTAVNLLIGYVLE